MKKIVTLKSDRENFKNGDWLTFDKFLDINDEVNVVKPEEPARKLRVFKVMQRNGFRHKMLCFDKRNRVSGLKKGMKFLYLKPE